MKIRKVLVLLVIAVMTIMLSACGEIRETKEVVTPIYSLDTGAGLEGNMSIGRGRFTYAYGTINNTINYYVYIKHGPGYLLKDCNAKETIVVDQYDEPNPRAVETFEITKVKINWLTKLNGTVTGATKVEGDYAEYWYCTGRVLYLPKGSIEKHFDGDIRNALGK